MARNRVLSKLFVLLTFLGLAVWAIWSETNEAAVAPAVPPAGDGGWRADPVWDDGRAEFCAYDVTWSRYGTTYPGRAQLILVKEPWAPDLEVKADTQRPDGFEVLKLNHIRDVNTGIYAYHQMASLFVRRGTGAMQKMSVMSSEGCGISTAHLTGGALNTRSYFDGQGESSRPYPSEALAEDGLAMTLRSYVEGELPAEIEVYPSLMTGRFPELEPRRMRLERRTVAELDLPEGASPGVELRLADGDDWIAYTFGQEVPHSLLHLERSDGTVYRLAKCERLPYWQLNRPGDEAWLPADLR